MSKNPQIKKANAVEEYTGEMIAHLVKSQNDPIYFIENFIKAQHPTRGSIPFILFEYQRNFLKCLQDNRFVVTLQPRQSGKTLTAAMYLLWYALFNSDVTVLIASKNQSHALEIAARIRYAYEELPGWIKCGVKYYNQHKMEFDNGSRIISEATTEKTGRGLSLTKIYLDELAFISPRVQKGLWSSLTPTLSTGGSAIISSTPNGDTELFAQLWRGANMGTNGYVPFEVHWTEHPERDEEYLKLMIGQLGEQQARQEILCVHGTTPITVRNKHTGEVEHIEFSRLVERLNVK